MLLKDFDNNCRQCEFTFAQVPLTMSQVSLNIHRRRVKIAKHRHQIQNRHISRGKFQFHMVVQTNELHENWHLQSIDRFLSLCAGKININTSIFMTIQKLLLLEICLEWGEEFLPNTVRWQLIPKLIHH